MRVKPLLLALILSAATTAHADLLQVTAGHVFLDPICDCFIAFDLRVDQLTFTGQTFAEDHEDDFRTVHPSPNPFVPGALANVSSRTTFTEMDAGQINGRDIAFWES